MFKWSKNSGIRWLINADMRNLRSLTGGTHNKASRMRSRAVSIAWKLANSHAFANAVDVSSEKRKDTATWAFQFANSSCRHLHFIISMFVMYANRSKFMPSKFDGFTKNDHHHHLTTPCQLGCLPKMPDARFPMKHLQVWKFLSLWKGGECVPDWRRVWV